LTDSDDLNAILSANPAFKDLLGPLWGFFAANPERMIVLSWLVSEANHYSNEKFFGRNTDQKGPGDDHDALVAESGLRRDGFWFGQVLQYADRAGLYGVGEAESAAPERGRQAMMKMLITAFDCAACLIRVHGLPPEPGHSSTDDLVEWKP
jgi:hypothetical protein